MLRRGARLAGGAVALTVLLAGCVREGPQDSLDPAGPYADKIHSLFTPVFWIAAAVFFLVEGALVYFLIRYRHRKGRDDLPEQVHGNKRIEIAWTLAPALVLAVIAVPTVGTIWDLSRAPAGQSITVDVTGHQWWWEFEYPDQEVITANQMHIPTGMPVYVRLASGGTASGGLGEDVIHSFWVPRLAGKQDVVPGRTNTLVLQADEPGTYAGQCAEFCGLSHANMRFEVIAETPEDFAEWVASQQEEAAPPPDDLAKQGMKLFMQPQLCAACHAIAGTDASAASGPNLTHFADRTTFAGGTLANNRENLERWLRDPPSVKPGSWMPSYNLSQEEIDALIAYLQSLE